MRILLGLLGLLVSSSLLAVSYPMPKLHDDLVGQVQEVKAGNRITSQIMQDYDVGRDELMAANPHFDFNYISSRRFLLIPTRHILPTPKRRGIVVNVAAKRLYFYSEKDHKVHTFPVGIGKQGKGNETPIFKTTIIAKERNPDWVPTKVVRGEFLGMNGFPMPLVVPSNPQNPLGYFALRLGDPTYLIHGTIEPAGVGSRVSAGCLRMLNQDVEQVYQLASVGTSVHIVNEPFLVGWQGNGLYLEAHKPFTDQAYNGYITVLNQAKKHHRGHVTINWNKAKKVAHEQTGIPTLVGVAKG